METTRQPKQMPTAEELEAMMIVPALLVTIIVFIFQLLIYGLPVVAVALPLLYSHSIAFTVIWLACIPIIYAFIYGLVSGILSLPFQRGIIKGVFPRTTRFPLYAMRRLYGLCWSSVYYFTPVYSIILNVPFFRTVILRLFGYRGSLNINLYPDAWIRDLPLLRIEDGVYISNRCSLGSNVSLIQGYTMVGNITIKKGALIGAHAKVGLGATIGENTEFGIESITGLHVKMGSNNIIGACCEISHYAKIGNNNKIGICSYIGTGAVIGDNLILPNKIIIPDKAEVYSMQDVTKLAQEQNIPMTQIANNI